MSNTASAELKYEIKKLIMETLNIKDISPDEVLDDAPLFGEGNVMGLDSIDAIEIVTVIQRTYHLRIDDQNLSRVILQSINTVAEFIIKEQSRNGSAQ